MHIRRKGVNRNDHADEETLGLLCGIICCASCRSGRVRAISISAEPRNDTFEQYIDCPQVRGETQPLTEHKLPSWMTLDGKLRSRTEDQTALSLLPGQGKFYELERIRGGMHV